VLPVEPMDGAMTSVKSYSGVVLPAFMLDRINPGAGDEVMNPGIADIASIVCVDQDNQDCLIHTRPA